MQNGETKKTKWALRILIAGCIGMGATVLFFATTLQNDTHTVHIGHTKIHVEIATSSQEKQRGLCCRDYLAENSGMLFIYDRPGDHRFWMKDTRIPLDMYWIDSQKKIVHIEHNVQPTTYPQKFGTDTPAQYILETNAGFAKKHNVKTGDEIHF